MAGQRIIAQNQAPRVRIANRGIATPLGVWQTGAATYKVGDVTWAPSLPPGVVGTWEDASLNPSIRLASDFPVLYATTGPGLDLNVTQNAQTIANAAAVTSTPSVAWNGAVYGTSGLNIRKKTTAHGLYGATLWSASQAFTANGSGGLFVMGAKLLVASQDVAGTGNTVLQVATDDATRTAEVVIPLTAGIPATWAFDTGAANTYLVSFGTVGVARTTNGGASWTMITVNLAGKNWFVCWRSGVTLYMLAADGFLASSANDGLTWAASGGAVPGVGAGGLNSVSYGGGLGYVRPGVAFDLPNRLLYVVGSPGAAGTSITFLSLPLDAPTTGFTAVLPSGTLSGLGGAPKFGGTAALLFFSNSNAINGQFQGVWQASLANPSAWYPLVNPPPWGPGASSGGFTGWGCVFGGQFIQDVAVAGGGTPAATWSFCDGVVAFDRELVPRTNANRPFMRVA